MIVADDKGWSPSDGDDEVKLRAPEGPSREEISRQLEPLPQHLPAAIAPAKPLQFSLGEVMALMVAISLGLAGGTWVPAEIFAAAMGLAMLAGLLAVHLYPPESRWARLLWWGLGLAYTVAVLAAVLKPASRL